MNSTLGICLALAHVTLVHIHTLNEETTFLCINFNNTAFFAFVITGDDFHHIIFFDSHLHDFDPYNTSGAKETIFM